MTEYLRSIGEQPGIGASPRTGVVFIGLSVLDPALVDEIAAQFPADLDGLCVRGTDPADVIPEGPQPQLGDGWRLLADEPGRGAPYRTGFAGGQADYESLWAEIGLTDERPPVDFADNVVVWFGPAVSGSCSNIRLDDVVVDVAGGLVLPLIVMPGPPPVGCTDDANPHAYVVALDCARLPDRFTIQLTREPVCASCPGAVTEVDLDA